MNERSVLKITSGGQTGADRAAMDFALRHGFESGGFVPLGRSAEDGKIDEKYPGLIETAGDDPAERTELNVLNSDATLIISHGPLTGGTLLTRNLAVKFRRPHLHIDLGKFSERNATIEARRWLKMICPNSLNIAGPRASEDSEIYCAVTNLLEAILVN